MAITESPSGSALRAIRAKCLDCSGGMPSEVRECAITRCSLHPFRMGKRPKKSGQDVPAEAKAVLLARLGRHRANSAEKLGESSQNERVAP